MSKLITHSTFDSNNIFIYSGKINNNFLKLDIARINEFNQIPLMLFIDEINVIDFNKNNILLDLRNQPDTRNMFTKLDEYIISYIQHMKIIKQYEFKNFTYKPFISSYTTLSNEVFDVLNLNISLEGTYHTMLFYSYNNPLKNLSVMKKNVKVKLVLECLSIRFNIKEKLIFIDNIVRQIKVKEIKPDRIKNLEYSFQDTHNEDDSTQDDIDLNKDSEQPVTVPKSNNNNNLNIKINKIISSSTASSSDSDSESDFIVNAISDSDNDDEDNEDENNEDENNEDENNEDENNDDEDDMNNLESDEDTNYTKRKNISEYMNTNMNMNNNPILSDTSDENEDEDEDEDED